MSYDHTGWLEDYATDAARTGELSQDEELGQPEGDRRPTTSDMAFEALLEQTYNLLNRPALHSHVCRVCHLLRPCLQQPCRYRAMDCEDRWICGECVCGEEA